MQALPHLSPKGLQFPLEELSPGWSWEHSSGGEWGRWKEEDWREKGPCTLPSGPELPSPPHPIVARSPRREPDNLLPGSRAMAPRLKTT